MPGAYAHITIVNELRDTRRLQNAGVEKKVIRAALRWFKFSELGAVSPDYPYLALGDAGAAKWADLMHYDRTGEVIHAAIRRLRLMSGEPAEKCMAWLLGYASHVVTDTTIHPVVELKVGPYAENKTGHRICEMHQDTYIFQRMNLQVQLAEHLSSGISRCVSRDSVDLLDPDLTNFWVALLAEVHPAEAARNPPDPNKWHRGFQLGVDKIAEEGDRLWPIARHVAQACGLTYPSVSDLDPQYLEQLRTPSGPMDYDAIFDAARQNVLGGWVVASNALVDKKQEQFVAALGNWNLDTGRDLVTRELVYWKELA